jgi:hypothetical protein
MQIQYWIQHNSVQAQNFHVTKTFHIIREESCAWLKLQVWFSIVLVGIDVVNIMAAYQPVVQA